MDNELFVTSGEDLRSGYTTMSASNDLLESNYANAQLDTREQARLKELETVIEQGLQTFYEVGKALDEIREKRLYRETHKTFEDYCREKWSIARRRAYQFIDAAQVIQNLCTNGTQIPKSERQVRLAYEREKIREELRVEIREEVKAEYEGQINVLTAQVTSLSQQLQEMTAKYEAVLARLEAIEGRR